MQLRDYMYVIAIAEQGSFTKAAKHLYITQSALSQGVSKLEVELGTKLFIRETTPITLTQAGEILLKDSYAILQIYGNIPKKIADLEHLCTGRLNIGISEFYCRYYFSKVIPLFRKKYPGIELHITEEISSVLEKMILRGNLDLSIFSRPDKSPLIDYEPIFDEPFLFATPKNHPLNKEHENNNIALSLFAHEDFIMIKEGQRMRNISMDLCSQAGFEPNIIFETRSAETVNAFIAAGMGVGFVPDAVRLVTLKEQQAAYFNLKNQNTTRRFVAGFMKGGYLSNAARTFITFAKQFSSMEETKKLINKF